MAPVYASVETVYFSIVSFWLYRVYAASPFLPVVLHGSDNSCRPSTANGTSSRPGGVVVVMVYVPCWNCSIDCGQDGVAAAKISSCPDRRISQLPYGLQLHDSMLPHKIRPM